MATLLSTDPWTEAMLRGDFEAAWRICDRVLEARRGRDCSDWPRHLQYVWNGSPLAGKHVLVRCYHGLGDTLQFVRLLAPLRERARRVALWVQPALIELLQGVHGADELLPLHDGAPDIEYDIDIELMELAHALRLSRCDLPGRVPYLSAASHFLLAHDAGAPLRVGLAWRSGDWNHSRSLTNQALRKLTQIEGVHWLSLQYPPETSSGLMQLGCRDLLELATRMCTLDLVISVDTMTAHLAGALALPVWTLLPYEADWRWMRERDDSPWYPTMRLFRQSQAGEWLGVIERVSDALRRRCGMAAGDWRSARNGALATSGSGQ